MDNLLVAVSNVTVLWPLLTSWYKRDYLTFGSLLFAGASSFISHLFESHKHGMYGFGCPHHISYLLNRMDVVGVALTTSRLLYLFGNKYGLDFSTYPWTLIFKFGLSFCLNAISEWDKTPSTKRIFLLSHIPWHLIIFYLINELLHGLYV